jgi:hypothetical protein
MCVWRCTCHLCVSGVVCKVNKMFFKAIKISCLVQCVECDVNRSKKRVNNSKKRGK